MNDVAKNDLIARDGKDGNPLSWLRGEIDRLFDDFGHPGRGLFNFRTRSMGPIPPMELADRGKDYCLTAELPGLTEKDVTVEFADGVLTIAGDKMEESEHSEGGCLLSERRYGSFARSFTLPADADADSLAAKVKHGVLTIAIGKDQTAAPKARKIDVKG